MKKATLGLISIIVLAFGPIRSSAQFGWKWGITTGAPSTTADVTGATVADKFGNVYLAAVQDGADSVKFGTIKVYDPNENYQCIVAKADSTGHFVWASGIQSKSATQPYSVAADSHGNLYLFGYYVGDSCKIGSVSLYRPSYWDMDFLAKFSPSGNVIWARNVSSIGGDAGTIGVDDSDNIYVQATFDNTTDTIGTVPLANYDKPIFGYTDDIYLAKFDSNGSVKWAINYGGKLADNCVPNPSFLCAPMAVGGNGYSYVTGQSKSDTIYIGSTMLVAGPADVASSNKISYLAVIDNNGSTVWAQKISNHIAVNGMSLDPQGNIYVTGDIDSIVTIGSTTLPWVAGWDYFIAKYDPNGNPLWAKSAGGTDKEQGYAVSVDQCGKLWVSGQTGAHETITLDGHVLTPDAGVTDPLFIAEYDTAGNYLGAMMLPSGGDDMCGIAIDHRGNFFLGGDYEAAAMYFGSDTLASIIGGEYYFIAKYTYDSGSCYVHDEGGGTPLLQTGLVNRSAQGILLYPNPATNELTISAGIPIAQVTISNLIGQVVFSGSFNAALVHVNIASLPSGVYLARINGAEVRKFLKE
jgi:type IX secretion system substrate protein